MLKMHNPQTAGDLNQRRPSRISASNTTTAIGQQQQQQVKLCSLTAAPSPNDGGRLKSSSIAKVPLAKSRLRQPVAGQQQPVELMATVGQRPTSLPLGCGATKAPTGRRSSLLPTSSSNRVRQTNKQTSSNTTQLINGSSTPISRRPATTTKQQASCSDGDCKLGGKLQPTKTVESNHQSGLKNLVAVVHPQHSSQRVNSNATAPASTINNKLPTTSTSTKPPQAATTKKTTTTTANSANNKLMSVVVKAVGSGKVNSNHKDVNGRETSSSGDGAGKQDGSRAGPRSQLQQMLFGSQKTTTTAAAASNLARDQVRNVSSESNDGSIISQQKASARVATKSQNERSSFQRDDLDNNGSTSNHDKHRQFTLRNGNNNYNCNNNNGGCQQTTATTTAALSVASKNFPGDDSDNGNVCLQQEKSKQTIKKHHPPGHTFFNSSLARPSIAGQQPGRLSDESGRPLEDNCYNHHHHHHRSAKSTLTKSTAAINDFNRLPSNGSAFNQRLLSKPMGQKVLSLMMLDVGLMPSNSNHTHQQQQYQQLHQPGHKVSSVSHVRIQSPPERDEGFDDSSGRVLNQCSFQNGHFLKHNRSDIADLENLRFQQQTANIPVNEILRLKLSGLDLDNQRTRSISLPSSPRLRVPQKSTMNGVHQLPYDHYNHHQTERVSRISSSFSNERTTLSSTNRLLSPSKYQGSEQNHLQKLSFPERHCEDPHSISSSCSSLNHNYPPLLAISNQLNDLNLRELILQRRCDPTRDENEQHLLLLNTPKTAIGQTNNNSPVTVAIPTVVANRTSAKTAHKSNCLEIGTISSENDTDDCDGGNSNCYNACSLKSKPSDTDSGYGNIGDHSPGTAEPTIPLSVHHDHSNHQEQTAYRDGESCLDPSLRQRQQQQQRSHSLSGQELSFNGTGGYQRLNQFITQHVPPELDHHRQRFGMQTPIYQPTQQQQQQQHSRTQLSTRSPSPLSYSGHINQNRDGYQNEIQKPRNQLHASLECLNSTYLEYQHQQQQQMQIRQQQQQHMSLQNQHYAATNYILATPPANVVVNQSGDQDLAAAAMDNNSLAAQHHHQQYQQQHTQHLQQSGVATPTPTNNIYAHQSIINRAMAQVHQSPARRFSSAQHGATGMASTLINNLTNLHHPIRAGHSSLSLSSSSYIIEDKLQNEIKKLHSELKSEKEKNEALNSQLNINSNLMAAFEQSLTTLNSRLRQLTTINERKDQDIEELRMQLSFSSKLNIDENQQAADLHSSTSPTHSDSHLLSPGDARTPNSMSEKNNPDERGDDLMKVIEDLKRQLIEKDRLLTDTRLEALSAAHQLEQLESRLDKEHRSIVVNEDDLDEGVMVVNHSPSDSDAVTDSAHFSEMNAGQMGGKLYDGETSVGVRVAFEGNSSNTNKSSLDSSPECNNNSGMMDNQSNHSSDYHGHTLPANEVRATNDLTNDLNESVSQQFNNATTNDTSPMDRLMDSLLSSAS